jgi:hypothetical protein
MKILATDSPLQNHAQQPMSAREAKEKEKISCGLILHGTNRSLGSGGLHAARGLTRHPPSNSLSFKLSGHFVQKKQGYAALSADDNLASPT